MNKSIERLQALLHNMNTLERRYKDEPSVPIEHVELWRQSLSDIIDVMVYLSIRGT